MIDAIIILSHRLEHGRVSREYKKRLDKGIELFFKKRAKYLVLCSETATESVKKYAIKKGIKGNRILLQPKSKNTIEEACFTKEILSSKKLKNIIVVSSDYHINYRVKIIFDCILKDDFTIKYAEVKTKRLNNSKTIKDQLNSLDYFVRKMPFKKRNVLCIGAHYDDVELACGGSIVKHIEQGDNVTVVVVSSGEYQKYDGGLIRDKEEAKREGKKAMKILGVKDLISLGKESKKIEYGVELIEKLNEIIDNRKIDIVYTHWICDIHQDHQAVGRATINAARHTPTILMYRSNWYSSPELFNGRFYVDISRFIDKKIASIKVHKGELKRRGKKWIDFVKHQNRNSGIEIGVEYAETFEIVKYLER